MTSDQVKLVKEANDIVAVISSYISIRPAGPTYKGLCPFHNDHSPSFDVNPQRQRYRCWSCGKFGDVLSFVQEYEKISFIEALELLARRGGVELVPSKATELQKTRAQLLDVMKWAATTYQQCFLDSPQAEAARVYLGERQLLGPTLRKFGVGFAPLDGDWLVQQAVSAQISLDFLERVGLVARRSNGRGFYDRFRDRVLFPIRDALGRPIAFGGRILPTSSLASRSPKYYNSAETPLFSKGEQLYGLDQARSPGAMAGFLAVVEGYTDVLMAHQKGIAEVVATMGTALTVRHVQHLQRFVPRVILVYDADAGGETGVDRALEIFVSQEVELAIATLPEGLDPCDLLLQADGPERFRQVLAGAVDALDFKLQQLLGEGQGNGVESRRRAVDSILGIIAVAPELPGQAGAVKRELIVSRISRRLALKEETIWARLEEMRQQRRRTEERQPTVSAARDEGAGEARHEKPAPEESQLLQILLADPELVKVAAAAIPSEEIRHPGLRRLLGLLYTLYAEGELPSLDLLRLRVDEPRQIEWAMKQAEVGKMNLDRPGWLQQVLAAFRERQAQAKKKETLNQLHGTQDHGAALELLKQLQNRNLGTDL